MKTTLEILKAARALVAKPNGWIRGSWAAKRVGGKVATTADWPALIRRGRYNCYCAAGAVYRVSDDDDSSRRAFRALVGSDPPSWDAGSELIDWNDRPRRTQKQVVALFDKAITAEKTRLAGLASHE